MVSHGRAIGIWLFSPALRGVLIAGSLALLAGPSAAQGVGKAEEPNGQQQSAASKDRERHTGMSLACAPSPNGRDYTCYREGGGEKPTLGERIWRWQFRLWRDPIAVFTVLLFIIGGLQVELSRRTARRQLRAYVFADHVGVSDGTYLPAPVNLPGQPRCFIVIKNTGQTPAYKVKHWGDICIKRVTEEDSLVPPASIGDRASNSIIPTGGINTKTLFYHRKPTPSEVSEIQTGMSALYVYGRIEYRDAFNLQRVSEVAPVVRTVWRPG